MTAIQPCALLLLVGPDWCLEAVSANAGVLGKGDPDSLLGQPLTVLLDSQEIHQLRNHMAWLGGDDSRVQDYGVSWGGRGGTWDVQASRDGDSFLIEAETSVEGRLHDAIGMARSLMDRVDDGDFTTIATQGLRQLRALTGFDRLSLCDRSGTVIAVSERSNLPPIGAECGNGRTCFPAVVADSSAEPVPLLGEIAESALQHAAFAEPDSRQRERLCAMGASGAMTLPLLIDGEWVGALNAHHSSPRRCGAERRSLAGLFIERLGERMTRCGWKP
ncbi:MAG TPA: GAF domain-containing protein [Sphingomicrobium sp.]|nr:GAF domain-containing protein [Sphingomicrobium sp.]